MRDAIDIVAAFEALAVERLPLALATIVAVEGSSYRRPGARMLIAADGRRFGTVSGGCLEADVARRSQAVIAADTPTLCRYETGGDLDEIVSIDDLGVLGEPGASLGCGGALEIFIEPVCLERPGALAPLLAAVRGDESTRHALIYRVGGSVHAEIGTLLSMTQLAAFVDKGGGSIDSLSDGFSRIRLPDGWIDVLVESFSPPQKLLILGDGSDVVPVIEFARAMGWHVTVAGYRAGRPLACDAQVLLTDHQESGVAIEAATGVLLMTHDLQRDARWLRHLASVCPAYVGVLGPLHRTQSLLRAAGVEPSQFQGRLYAPVGLDLGGEGPHRVALSIVSEMAAVFADRSARHLRDKAGGIHEAAAVATALLR